MRWHGEVQVPVADPLETHRTPVGSQPVEGVFSIASEGVGGESLRPLGISLAHPAELEGVGHADDQAGIPPQHLDQPDGGSNPEVLAPVEATGPVVLIVWYALLPAAPKIPPFPTSSVASAATPNTLPAVDL